LPLLSSRARKHATVVGNPVRPELFGGKTQEAVEALKLTGFDRSLPTVYVTGGAQGAQQINRLVTELLPWLLERANVVHGCGPLNLEVQRKAAEALPPELASRYHVAAYIGPELPDVFALSDLVVARSGAGTISELTALGKPAILIPLPSSAGGEQTFNAQELQRQGAARALTGDITAQDLRAEIEPLLTDSAARVEMASRARSLGRPDAARALAALILSEAGGENS
jgi:UDP-N-acetylglucosamine--N-acetylmuramyl-(pentapeptide) pyrophosphoryl-undecaprenol N-acetylglucosamine transferase